MQSFPLDYLPDRGTSSGSAAGGGRLTLPVYHSSGSGPPAPRHISTGRLGGPSHAHCVNCGSGQALPAHHSHHHHYHARGSSNNSSGSNDRRRRAAPDVPKRTLSRLTSLDVGESSELYPARSSSEQLLQQQQLLQLASRHGEQQQLLQLSGRLSEQQQSRTSSSQSSPR